MHYIAQLKNSRLAHTWRSHPRPFGLSKDLWLSLGSTLVVVITGLYLGWDNNRVVRSYPKPGFHYLREPHNILSFFANWDGVDYIHIAEHGYKSLFWVNWFPLYPILINLTHRIIPSMLDSAFLIAWTSLVVAIFFFIKIVRHLYKLKGDFEPLQAVMFFVLFPTGVFLIAPFSESLYAALALGSIYFALKKRWLVSSLFALFCTATHITGPFVVVASALILLEQNERWRNVIIGIVIGSLGLLSYMTFLLVRFHRPFGFFESQQIYHSWTGHGFLNLITTATPSRLFSVLLIVLATSYWWNRRRSLAIYSVLFLTIPLVGRQYGGFNRYILMAFPVQFMLYGFFKDKKSLLPYITAIAGAAWIYVLLQYAGGYTGS